MTPATQTKILRVLQSGTFERVGGNQPIKVDVRVIAATNRDLEASYMNGTFRKDLYFRLNVVTIHLPALRERKSDIPTLVQFFLEKMAPNQQMVVTGAAMKSLLAYSWPGNVRELQNCIERAVALGNHTSIDVQDLPPAIAEASGSQPATVVESVAVAATTDLEEMERITIQRVFEQVKGDKTAAGKMLGISRATLYRKIKRYGIATKDEPETDSQPQVKVQAPMAMAAGMK